MKEIKTNKGTTIYELSESEKLGILTALLFAEDKFLDKDQYTYASDMRKWISVLSNPTETIKRWIGETSMSIKEERINNRIEKENKKMDIKEKVLRLAMQEVPNKLIAEVLDISENSVRNILELRKVEERINNCIEESKKEIDEIEDRYEEIDEMLDILEGKYDGLIIKGKEIEDKLKAVDKKRSDDSVFFCEKIDSILRRLDTLETVVGNNNTHHIKKENGINERLDSIDEIIQKNSTEYIPEVAALKKRHIQSISIYFGDGKDDENE